MEKRCKKCNQLKPCSEFVKCKTCKNGVRGECNQCFSKRNLKSYYKNREKINERRRLSYTGTTEEIRIRQKNWSKDNPDKMKVYQNRKYLKHKDKIIKTSMKWNYHKLKTDPLFKLRNTLRSRIYNFLKSKGLRKKSSTESIIGCSKEFFKEHLQKMFVDGMSWENHGEWHIDHIIPLANGTNEEEIYKLFHYSNMQPLWGKDNLKKWKHIL